MATSIGKNFQALIINVENVVRQTPAACCVSESAVKRKRDGSLRRKPDWRRWSKLSREGLEFPHTSLHTVLLARLCIRFTVKKEHPNVDIRKSSVVEKLI